MKRQLKNAQNVNRPKHLLLLLLCVHGSGLPGHGHTYNDFAGLMDNLTFLVIVDSHSKWIEVVKMNSTTTTATVRELRTVFAHFGIPESIVSDNGPQFTSGEFAEFCHLNGMHHVHVPPFHPSSNGLAERAVQTFKKGFKKTSEGSVQDKIARFLFSYCKMPQTTTETSPAEFTETKCVSDC